MSIDDYLNRLQAERDARRPDGCTCERGDTWCCLRGEIYGPCESKNCGGVCEPEGACDCPLHASDPDHDGHDGAPYKTQGQR